MTLKNPTAWIPQSGHGFVIAPGNLPIVTNLLLPIVDNTATHKPIVTTPDYVVPKYPTAWAGTGV